MLEDALPLIKKENDAMRKFIIAREEAVNKPIAVPDDLLYDSDAFMLAHGYALEADGKTYSKTVTPTATSKWDGNMTFSAGDSYIPDIKPSMRNDEHNRILVIGDIHAPFDYEPYFDHCVAVYDKYQCNRVVFIGDIIDNHYSSYHETDADGMGGQEELDLAIERLQRWYEAFPNADVIIGNHDRMVMRKAQSSSIPTRWIKAYVEVLGTPGWNFVTKAVYDGVQYLHGEGGMARSRATKDLMSTVQGHLHTKCFVEWHIGAGLKLFAMQVGCGIDAESYAMAYAKDNGQPAIACGVVLNGKVAINEVLSTRGDIS
jgi:predicted phosphodiesterase